MFVESNGGQLPELGKRFLSPITVIVLGVFLTLLGPAILRLAEKKFGIPPLDYFDDNDMGVYFSSTRWMIDGGRLYREVPSEYPLFANMIFAGLRYLGHLLQPGVWGFYSLWIASAWFIYLYAVYRIAKDTTMLAALVWLAPAPIYFSLFRFDIYPAVATLMSLFAIRRTAYVEGAVWLGVALALKGYALFLLPAYCVFIVYQRGLATASKVGALAIAPMMLSLFVTFTFSGWEGVVAPFEFHAERTFNGDSTYAAINYLFGADVISKGSAAQWIGWFLQVGCALAAAAIRPRNFQDLVNAFLFAILGFMSFSVFYSPQYLLWILPLICFADSQIILISAMCLSWLTYLYFPISYGHEQPGLFEAMIVAVSLFRFIMMFQALRETIRRCAVRCI